MAAPHKPTLLDRCLMTLREQKVKICHSNFENNNIAIQQALDELREERERIRIVEQQLNDLGKTKSHTLEWRTAEAEYDFTEMLEWSYSQTVLVLRIASIFQRLYILHVGNVRRMLVKDLHLQRKRGLESILYITELESSLTYVQDDVETRALYLAQRPEVFRSVYRHHHQAASRMHTDCVEAMRKSWHWLSELTSCLTIHLHNAARYQQFFYDARHLETDLDSYLDWLDSEPLRAPVKTRDPVVMTSHFRAILSHLLQLEARVSRLCESCRLVVPVHLRKQGTAVKPLRAEALVNYCHRQISLQKDEACTIVDNSDPERWRVLTKDGQEAEVPSIILVIPAPDPESFRTAHRVRSQLAVHWSTTAERLGSQLAQFISIIGKDTQTKELAAVSSDQKAALMKMMNDILRTLPAGDSNFATMKTEVVRLRKLLVQVKAGAKVASNQTVKMWEGTMAAYQVFADFLVYAHAYRMQLGEHVTEESVLAADPVCPPAYVSRAYFERALPSVSIDVSTKRSQVTGVQCQIYIHERHRGPRDGVATPLHGAVRTESRALQHVAGPLTESSSPQASSVVIVGVLDPRKGQQISARQAIQRGILNLTSGTYHSPVSGACLSLPAAIEQGLVQVDFCRTQTDGESFDVPDSGEAELTSQLETVMCSISGVVEPASGEWVSTKDAVARGLISPHTATFRNSLTGEEMSLGDAVKAGFLIAEQLLPPEENSDDVGVFTSVVWLDVLHKVSGVVDLFSGDVISLERALQAGLVDPVKGTYRDAVSGEVMGIEEALRRGLIKGKPFDPAKDRDEGDVLTFQQLQIQRQRFLPLRDTDIVLQEDLVQDSNTKLLQHLLERVDPSRVAVKDVSTGRTISLQEAFDKGIVNLAAAQFDTLVGNLLPIQEAAASGYIEPTILKDILNTYQDCSIGNLIKQGKFDPDTGLVTDISTGRTLSLETAIECNLIDASTTFFFDVSANRFVSMEEALKTGQISRTTGRVVMTENGHELSVKEAEQQGYILTNPDPSRLADAAGILNVLRDVMDTSTRGIKLAATGRVVNVQEGVILGLLDMPSVSYCEAETGKMVPLQTAVKKGNVEAQAALALLHACSKLSLHDALQAGKLDPRTGHALHPESGQPLDLATARHQGLWNPHLVFCVDETSGLTSLGTLMDQGRFDPHLGKLRRSNGELLTLEEAIAREVLTTVIQPEQLLDGTASLTEMFDLGQVNPQSTTFVGPNDYRMSLRDALANGFLTLSSKVKQDPDTGDIYLARDDGVVRALVDIKENTDWLADVERAMARQARPSQRLQRLKEQIDETQGVRREVSQKEGEVRTSIEQAEELIAAGGQHKSDTSQQLQKLKYNTADLKLRFDTVLNEAESREHKMVRINDGLEEFYFRLDETDQWLDSAIERTQDLQASHSSLEEQLVVFKDFVEEVKIKEEDMTKLTKTADAFKEQSQELERDVEAFRTRLQILPTISEEVEIGILEEELESIEAKYKDVSRECSRHIDRLASIVKNKKSFDELNDRLDDVYPKLEEQVTKVTSHELGKSPGKDEQDLESVRTIKAELIRHERRLKELTTAGERLMEGLKEAGLTWLLDDVHSVMEDRAEQHSALLQQIGAREEQLNLSLSHQHNAATRLDAVLDMVQQAEHHLKSVGAISLDKERLADQLQDQRLMNADISSNKALLERLAGETGGVSGATHRLAQVNERLGAVQRFAECRTRELEEVATGLQVFDSRASDMVHWLGEALRDVKSSARTSPGKAHWAKVHRLLESKEERAEELKDLRSISQNLMNDDRVTDKYAVQETLTDMEGKWNELTELLVKEISFETVTEVEGFLKYLDKAENDINTAEPISVDPETLRSQLRDHNAFHEDLTQRKNTLKELIAKGRALLHETANTKTEEIESRWDSIENQADLLSHHSADRQRQLESALPLALQLNENLSEVEAWLEEMEAELKAQNQGGDSLEEAKKQHDNLKTTQQIIDDHKLFIDDLNSTGMDLMDVCGVVEAGDLHNKLMALNTRYETLRSQARARGRDLAEKKRKLTQEFVEGLDQLLEDIDNLKRVVSSADPVPAVPAKLRNEIDENMAVIQDLERMKPALLKAEEGIKDLTSHGIEDPGEVEDVKSRVAEITQLCGNVGATATQRDKLLRQVLHDATQYLDLTTDVLSSLRDLKDSLLSQQLPGVDTATIREQQSELAGIKTELEKAKELIGDCRKHADDVGHNCGEPGRIELQKQLEDLTQLADDVNDLVRERGDELRKVFRHADHFSHLLEAAGSWLPLSEHKMASMRPPSSDIRELTEQIEEIKLFKSQVHPHIVEMQQLNQQLDALKDQSPVAAEALYRPVLAANEKWNDLLRSIADRETKLNDMLVKIGKIDYSMEDVMSTLEQLQADIKSQRNNNGDPKYLETILRKLQLMQSDLHNQEKTVRRLTKAVDDLAHKTDIDEYQRLSEKRQVMVSMLRTTKALAKDAENEVQDKMRQVKRFLGEVDRNLQAINDFRHELKNNLPFGALPETCEHQYNAFTVRCQELDGRERSVQTQVATAQHMTASARPEDVAQVTDKIKRLRERWQDTRERAIKRKIKMEENKKNVHEFHDSLKAFTDWLNTTEVSMRAFVYPSKLVDRILKQIEEHNAVRADLAAQSERMATLDKSGTFLKHFGRKQDTIYVKNLLVGIRLRWKKILRRTDERGRLLQQAFKEDKRFQDAWQDLCQWLDDSTASLSGFLSPNKQPNLMKTDLEELKKFQTQLATRNATFFATTRLGRSLKDRCTKTDPEREVLTVMLEELRTKWNAVRSVISKSQNKLDEALLTSGRVSDALHSLLDWLQKAEATLSDDLPVLGDLDTVHMLIEQHRNLQQELAAREPTITTMRAPGNLSHTQHEELSRLWGKVSYLCEVRENKLTDALKLAEEFQEVVSIMREFLPEAEAQLKFRSLPDDEVAILQMIEKHEKFEEDLKSHQEHVDKIKSLAEEILSSCHPNAVRFVKYYLTITQTRWDQLLERAQAKGERLREARQQLQGLAESLEDMLVTLTEYQALLATKESDPIPHDLNVVDALLKEHQEVYAELIKLSESDDFMRIMSTEAKSSSSPAQRNGSNMRLNEAGRNNPRYATLQSKWRTVSRMAIERKKKLQDAYDMLQELENFKSFDFESWRSRYLKWIQAKKFRITDFFRRQDKDGDGFLNQEEFVGGMLQSRFPTTKTELNAVFDIFDRERRGLIAYKDFVDALKPDKTRNSSRALSDDEVIQDAIELETSSCTCRNQFRGIRIDEGKYRFGEKQKIVLVRLLNKSVMVRVGGGWIPLEEFVLNNDPCKAKGRTNFDLREQLALDDTSQTFTPRRSSTGRISPFPSATMKRRQNDTGYASSNSSVGSGDTTLRRSRVTSSMVNLSSNSPSLQRNPDYESDAELASYLPYGSTGNLVGQRSRTPKSSVSSTGRRTPTSVMERRRTNTTQRSITPTVAFGSTVRSRPTTPNSFSTSTHSTSSMTPKRPGSATPTRQLDMDYTPRHRRLPAAPAAQRTTPSHHQK